MSRQSWILDFQRWQRRHLFASWSPVLQGRLPTASSTRLDQCTLIFVCFLFSFYLMWLYDSLGGIRLCLWRRPGWLLLHKRKKKNLNWNIPCLIFLSTPQNAAPYPSPAWHPGCHGRSWRSCYGAPGLRLASHQVSFTIEKCDLQKGKHKTKNIISRDVVATDDPNVAFKVCT